MSMTTVFFICEISSNRLEDNFNTAVNNTSRCILKETINKYKGIAGEISKEPAKAIS